MISDHNVTGGTGPGIAEVNGENELVTDIEHGVGRQAVGGTIAVVGSDGGTVNTLDILVGFGSEVGLTGINEFGIRGSCCKGSRLPAWSHRCHPVVVEAGNTRRDDGISVGGGGNTGVGWGSNPDGGSNASRIAVDIVGSGTSRGSPADGHLSTNAVV